VAALATGRITYIHTDALGSPIMGTNAQGDVVWREDYQPYGERFQGSPPPSQRLYTGKYAETSTGLVDYGGRWYNPEIGRFYSVDPEGFDEANPHSFNRYAYANNNPYRFVDPDGEAVWDIVKLVPAAGASFGALAAYTQGQITADAALVDVSLAGMNAIMGSNAEALVSLVTPPGTARTVMNVAEGANSSVNGVKLQKQLASQEQLGQLSKGGGTVISQPAKQADRVAAQTSRNPANIQKVSSDARAMKDGQQIQTHSFRDASTNELIEPKTIIGD
jgi:RHS repeat-associated protein